MYREFVKKLLKLPQNKRIEWLCEIYANGSMKIAGNLDI